MTEFAILDATPNGPGKTSDTEDPSAAEGQETHKQNPSSSGLGALGYLLDEKDDRKRAKYVHKQLWMAQEKAAKNRAAVWAVNSARRDGDPFARVKKEGIDEDVVYSFYRPKGSENTPPSLNKTDDLCIKVVSQLLVDPPSPECEPASDEDGDRDKAEFSERVLKDILSESGINGTEKVRDATDMGCAFASGFLWAYTDPFGGGYRPKEIMASMAAMTVQDALFVQSVGAPPAPMVGDVPDPSAGGANLAPSPQEPADSTPMPQPEPYVIRYVKADQTLTDEPSEADIEWLPKIEACVLTGNNVRFLPDSATDIRDAHGVVICRGVPLGTVKARYPDTVGKMSPEDLRKLCKFRPEKWRNLVPKHVRPDVEMEHPRNADDKGPPDQTLVFVYYTFYRSTPEYKKGAYVLTSGEEFTLEKGTWTHKVERKGKEHEVPMDVPVAQFRQFKDTTGQDPYGKGLVDKIGDGDPLLAIALGALVEYLPMALRPHLFVPVGSGITPKDLALPRGIPIPYNPSAGGVPIPEKIAVFPKEAMELYDRTAALMDSRSGLNDIAQGSDQTEQSGRSRAQAVEQALVAVSGLKRGLDDGFVRLCRIILQLVKRDYTMPQKLKIVGEGGSYKVKEWTGAELGDTTDVKIQSGTSTMLPLSAKQQMAQDELTLMIQIPDPSVLTAAVDKYKRVTSAHMDPMLAVEDDPIEQEIKRSLGQWRDGAPDGWQAPQPPLDALGQPLLDPVSGQPVPLPPDPANPFVRLPHHLEQDVALARHAELKRTMATVDAGKQTPEWQALLFNEYEAMRQAAGIQTIPEQQQAQQAQQAQMEQQAQGAQESQQQADAQNQQSQQDAQAQQAQADAQASGDQQASQQAHEQALEAMKATTQLQTAAMKASVPKGAK